MHNFGKNTRGFLKLVMPLSKSQVASVMAGISGFLVAVWPQVISNWATIEPQVKTTLQAHWFDHHPVLKSLIMAVAFGITMYARSLSSKKSGIPGQAKTSAQVE